jgi:hypothetical protein
MVEADYAQLLDPSSRSPFVSTGIQPERARFVDGRAADFLTGLSKKAKNALLMRRGLWLDQ